MAEIVDDSNDKHFEPWTEACNRDGLQYTPLSPYLHQVCNKHVALKDHSVYRKYGLFFLCLKLTGAVCFAHIRISITRQSVRFRQFTDPDPVFADPARIVDTLDPRWHKQK